jgi:hypothetical protein
MRHRLLWKLRWIWREHPRLMLIGLAAVVLVAPTLYWSFSDQPHDGKPSHAQQAAICRAARLSAYRLGIAHPDAPVKQIRAAAEQICHRGAQFAPGQGR